jgi:hypothetical protein
MIIIWYVLLPLPHSERVSNILLTQLLHRLRRRHRPRLRSPRSRRPPPTPPQT